MRRPWLTLLRDRRGVSAVEFAMLAPVMVAFYFGLSELCQGYMAQKRVGHVASIIADLISQDEAVSSGEIADIFTVGATVLKPFSSTTLAQRVSSVTVDSSGVARVDWSRGSGMTARAAASTVTLPSGLVGNGESVIMSEVTYDYDSPVDYMMPGLTRFSQTHYLRPRRVDRITFE
ncbi:TadE/TadG family type IV pilus assembly protein [Brevundimonas sp.]|uniref:TadE/TadG family type IV pilus assembly protein n=1 Tax=Brevundimonas sp. TaxID=1871086 RepID=UPI0025D90113|nr:TadE/TadG family type IV pilus assembly protein [Brevundimonas sp.]